MERQRQNRFELFVSDDHHYSGVIMPAALFEFANDANGVGECGGIIHQGGAELIASHMVGPSDREKVARHQRPPDLLIMWDNEDIGARAVWIIRNRPGARKGCPKAQFEQLREIFRPRRRECLKKAASGAN